MTERYLPATIDYRKHRFESDVRACVYLAAWKDIDRLIEVMQDISWWDTIVTVVR